MAGALVYYVLFNPLLPRINKWGVVLRDPLVSAKGEPQTFATWVVDKGPSSLILTITCLRATQVTFPHLLCKLLEVAVGYGIQIVEVLNLPHELAKAAGQFGGTTEEGRENLPAFKWYGGGKAEGVDWLFDEKQVIVFQLSRVIWLMSIGIFRFSWR
jgi:hypothetical protein